MGGSRRKYTIASGQMLMLIQETNVTGHTSHLDKVPIFGLC